MIDVGTATAFLDLDISNFMHNLQKAMADTETAARSMDRVFDNQQRSVGQKISGVGDTIVGAGQKVTTALSGVARVVESSVNTALDFYSAMDRVKSVMRTSADWTDEAYDEMADAARQWGKTTVYNAEEAADALYYMGLAGWSPNESIAALGPVLKLAAAGNMDLGRTSDIVTDAMNALHLSADGLSEGLNSAEWFTSVLAATMANSNTTTDLLGESFKYVASTVGALESPMYSAEQATKDLSFMLGLEADAGIKAAQGGTSLRRVLVNLLNPQRRVKEGLEAFNLSMEDVDLTTKGVKGTMDMFRNILRTSLPYLDETAIAHLQIADGLSEEEAQMQLYNATQDLVTEGMIDMNQQQVLMNLAKISGVTAVSGFLSILMREQDEYDTLYNVINNATVSQLGYNTVLDDMYADMTKTKGPMIEFKSAINELGIEMGENVLPILINFVNMLSDLVRAFGNLPESVQTTIMYVGLFSIVLGPIITSIGRVVQLIGLVVQGVEGFIHISGNLIGGITSIGTSIGGVLTNLLGVGSAIGGSILAVSSFVDMWQNGWNILSTIFEALGLAIAAIGATLLGLVSGPVAAVVAGVIFAVSQIVILVKDNFNEIVDFIGGVLSTIWDLLSGLFSFIGSILSSIWNVVSNLFSTIINGVSSLFSTIYDLLSGLFNGIVGILQGIWDFISGIISWVIDAVSGLFSNIIDLLSGLISGIIDGVSQIWSFVSSFFGELFNAIADVFNDITSAFGSLIDTIFGALEGLFNWVIDFFSNLLDTVINFFSTIVDYVTSAINAIWNVISGIFGWIVSGVQDLFSTLISIVGDIFSNIISAVGDGVAAIWDAISSGLGTIVDGVIDIGRHIVEGLWEGISGAIGWLYDQIAGFCSGVWNAITSFFGISSPSKLMEETVGKYLPAGIAVGFEKGMNSAVGIMQDSLNAGVDELSDNVGDVDIDINADVSTQANNISQNIMSVFSVFGNYVDSVESSISASIDRMTEKLASFMEYSQYVMNDEGVMSLKYMSYTPFGNQNIEATEFDDTGINQISSGSGDTIIIQSPRPIDEIEAARQIKKVKQEMQEGL